VKGATEEAAAQLKSGLKRLEAGRYADAERHARLALRFAPTNADARNLLGVTLVRTGRFGEAVEHLRIAAESAPQVAGYQMNLGYALLRDGLAAEAIGPLEHATRLEPALVGAQFYLALALRANGDHDAAEPLLRRVLENAPSFEEARHELNKLLYDAGRIDEAQALLRQAPAPASPARRLRLALTRLPPVVGSIDEIAALRARLGSDLDALAGEAPRIADPLGEVDVTAFFLSYHGLPNRALHEKLAQLYLAASPALAWTAPHCAGSPRKSGKLRIGILSRYLRLHSIGRTTRGLVEKLDRERFELTAIFVPPVARDEYARAIAANAARVLVLPASLEQARAAIARLELDVLFYPDIGMDPFTYFLAYARLAPVQCVSFGHPDTTGIPNMDWWISSEHFEADGADGDYSERLWRIPEVGTLAYYYHPARNFQPPGREALGLPGGARLYTCPQTLFKLHPQFDALAAGILRNDGEGRLVLIEPPHRPWLDALMQRLRAGMPDVLDRVLVLPAMSHERFLGLLAASDVVLDTPHFNGMNSTLESFAVGTPVVTRPGPLQRTRHTAGMYAAMGMNDLCASSDEEYIRLALEVARDREMRTALSETIRAREAALFEDARVVRGFETFFESAVMK
jgi:predicted O-linked N-acetylglucosamine transferase (SPINDLY family)